MNRRLVTVSLAAVLVATVVWTIADRSGQGAAGDGPQPSSPPSVEFDGPHPAPLPGTRSFETRFHSFDEAWSGLVPRAEAGDADAALQLFAWIDRCRSVLAGNPTREALIEQIREIPGPPPPERWKRHVLRTYDGCSGSEDPARLETARDAGSLRALAEMRFGEVLV